MTVGRSRILTAIIALALACMASVSFAAPIEKGTKGSPSSNKAKPDDKNKADEGAAPELVTPNFMNTKYGFGVFVPEGYASTVSEESQTWKYTPSGENKQVTKKVTLWMLGIENGLGDTTQPTARLTIEKLPEKITDVGGFWQLIKDRDTVMAHSTTYERVTRVAGSGAVQARIERLDSGRYILAILWIWVHDGYGYTLTGYPPQDGDFDQARELAKNLTDQFRWMTKEEIDEVKNAPPVKAPIGKKPKLPPGRAF
jgi:hypothetical protein